MKTKEELADDYMERLHLLGEDFSPLEIRRAFLAGYRDAMYELSELLLYKAVEATIHEANEKAFKILGVEKLFYEENTGNYYRTIEVAKKAAKKLKSYHI